MKLLPLQSFGIVHMAHSRNVLHSSSKKSELQTDSVCCNLHCRELAVVDDNKLVVVLESQSMAKLQLQVFLRPKKHVHNSLRPGCVQCAMIMTTSAQLEILKPQVLRWRFVVVVTMTKAV